MDLQKIVLLVLIALVLILAAIVTCQQFSRSTTFSPQGDLDRSLCTIDDVSVGELSAVARLLLSFNGKGRFGVIQGSVKLSRKDFRVLSDQLAVLLGFDDINEVPDNELPVAQLCDALATDIDFKSLILRYPEVLEDAFNGYRLRADPDFQNVSMPYMPSVATIQIIYTVAARQATATDRLAKARIPIKELAVMAEWIFGCGNYGYATFNNDELPITDGDRYNGLLFGMADILGFSYTAALPDAPADYNLLVRQLTYEHHKDFLDLLIEFGDFLTVLKLAFDEKLAHNSSHAIAHFVPDSTTFHTLRELHADYRLVSN